MTEENVISNHPKMADLLIGHEAAERTFLEAFNTDRLHHAWLITGPKGVGKATLAWRFAKFLLTQDEAAQGGPGLFGDELPSKADSLTVASGHPVVQRIISGGHGGVSSIERSFNAKTGKMRTDIVIDDVRKLINFYTQTSSEGGWRVAIVDAADELNVNAANALLKLLEEPPAKSILFLIAHSPGKLLPTIRSRCRTLGLQALSEDSVQAVLAARFPDLQPKDLRTLARLSSGAPGRAVQLAEMSGVSLYNELSTLLSALPRLNTPAVHTLAGKLAAPKADSEYRLFVEMFLGWLNRMVRQTVCTDSQIDIIEGESATMQRISANAGLDQWLDLWEKMGRLVSRADAVNLDKKQVIVNLFSSVGALARGQA